MDLVALFVGIAIGTLLGAFGCLAFRRPEAQGLDESTEKQLIDRADGQFKQSIAEMETLLKLHEQATKNIDDKGKGDREKLLSEVRNLSVAHGSLKDAANRLSSTLSTSGARGSWGEVQLDNVLQHAGINERLDYDRQPQVEGAGKPDVLIRLPKGGQLVIDAKTPFDRFQDAMDHPADSDKRSALLLKHADLVLDRVKELSSKQYQNSLDKTVDFVVMFVPLESALVAALEVKPEIHEKAMKLNVIIATPMLLLALLRTVEYFWRQHDQAKNVKKIADVGRELHKRIGDFNKKWHTMGTSLKSAVKAYNESVGTLETRVIASSRDLHKLGAADGVVIAEPESPVKPEDVRDIKDKFLSGEPAE